MCNFHSREAKAVRFSIIIPVYNALPYLVECLDSLLGQGMDGDMEIICVNDGSTDGSLPLLETYAAAHPELRVVDQPNSGVVAARNRGLAMAQGEYIWFVDADDLVGADALSLFSRHLAQDVDLLQFGAYQFEERLPEDAHALARAGKLPATGPGAGSVVWRSLIRREFLRAHGLHFSHPALTHGEDGQFLYEVHSCQPRTVTIPDVVYYYRVRMGSAETAASPAAQLRKYHSHREVARIMKELYDSGRRDARTADRLMLTAWMALYDIAGFSVKQAVCQLRQLKQDGLWPFSRPPECSLTCTYMFDTGSLSGRVMDRLFQNQHHLPGLMATWLARHLLRLVRRVGRG